MATQEAQAPGQVIPVRHHHSAFAGGQVLVAEERKTGDVTQGADSFAVGRPLPGIMIMPPNAMTRVFNQNQAMRRTYLADLGHPTGIAAVMHDHHRFGSWANMPRHGSWIDGWFAKVDDIGEDRM